MTTIIVAGIFEIKILCAECQEELEVEVDCEEVYVSPCKNKDCETNNKKEVK